MKLNHLHLAALAALSLVPAVSAATTVIDITGATAFRSAAVNAIKAAYISTGSFGAVQYGFVGTSFTGAGQQIFKGNFPGVGSTSDVTIIRTSWSGSTEGARSCIFNTSNNYLATGATVSTGGTSGLSAGTTASTAADIYFSDVSFSKTQYNNFDFTGQPEELEALLLEENRVGAIVFCPIKNNMASGNTAFANYSRFTNITALNWRSLYSSFNSGRSRLSSITGDSSDDAITVFATGRNDLSGTRTSYLLESGYGANVAVNQWKMFSTTNTNVITTIQNWPTGDNTPNNDNRSVQFTNADSTLPAWTNQVAANEAAGNGGYFSGSVLRDQMDDTSAAVLVKDAAGGSLYGGVAQNVIMVSYVGNADAATAIAGGAKALTWNGVGITPNAGGLSAADKAKITRGDYTAWNFENIVLTGGADSDEATVYNAIKAAVPANIGSAGLTMTEMGVLGLTRSQDGGVVNVAIP